MGYVKLKLMDNPLKKEFDFYKENHKSLAEKYKGRFIVLKDKEVKGVYDSEIDAYNEAKEMFELGSFIIQKVDESDSSYTQTFYSRVSI